MYNNNMQLMIDNNVYFHKFVAVLAWIKSPITFSMTSNTGMKCDYISYTALKDFIL